MTPWFKKYSPKNIKEVLGHNLTPIIKHAENNSKKKALLIHGPAGTGKTCSVHALAREQGYELVELNASNVRNKDAIKRVVGNASVTMSFFGRRIILIDDVDSLNARDRGGITELINCIKKTRTPIFLTAIDPWDSKLRTLRGYCNMVELRKVRASTIKKILRGISEAEGVKVVDAVLYSIASNANGDVRAAINNLEMLSGDGEVTEHELDAMGFREKPVSIFNGLKTLFNTERFFEAVHSLDEVNLDMSTKMLWVLENLAKEFNKGSELASAFNALSRADVFNGRIMRQQYWRFLFYVNLFMTAGVNASKETSSGFVRYDKPTKILKLWKSKHRRELRKQLAQKLQSSINASIHKTLEVLPFIKILAKNDGFVSNYELTADEIRSI